MDTPITFLSAAELASKISSKEISPVEVVENYLSRIKERNPTINAYITILEEGALKEAREKEQGLMDKNFQPGVLHGIPIAIKDLADHKEGVTHTFGSKPLQNYVSDHSSPCVERLEKAGAIVLGKTNTPEFGHKGTTDNLFQGPTSTPFAVGCNAGGSSGGSAAAVADGMAAIALGSDGGGSVRIPASCCHVFGFKPTFGRVPMDTKGGLGFFHTPYPGFQQIHDTTPPFAHHISPRRFSLALP